MNLNKRLERWATWCVKGLTGAARGYPSQTVLSRFKADGGVILGGQGKSIVPIDEIAEEIELLMGRLRKCHPINARVIEKIYIYNQQPKDIAVETGRSEKVIYTRLKEGKMWLDGALANNRNKQNN